MLARFVQAGKNVQSIAKRHTGRVARSEAGATTGARVSTRRLRTPGFVMADRRDTDTPASRTDPLASLRAALRGRYEIERQIGQGAFATVYLARDLKHERKVAIKVLNADPSSETGEIRFIREIRLVARLQHPNILPLHDSGHVENQLYYVMPYVMGETLRIRMHRERQMGVEASCAIAREAADALAYAHSQGIVHRDIKPENILLSGGHSIVADFGIARAIDVSGVKQLTMTGMGGPGTPAYMSPEQLLGDRAVDARSDIYSLGCVLYEMLAGKPPFSGKDGFVKRFTEPPPRLMSLRRDAPPWIDETIARALAKDPADRFATATDLVAALSQPLAGVRTPRRATPMKHALVSPPLFETDPLEAQEIRDAFPAAYPSAHQKGSGGTITADSVSPPRHWMQVVHRNRIQAFSVGLILLAVAVAAGAAGSRAALRALFGAAASPDSTRFVVLASTPRGSVAADVADSIYDAFTKWEGVPVVPDTRVAQAILDGASPPATEAAVFALARRLGAGKAIWVQASGNQRAPRIRVHVYDSESAESLHEFGIPPARGEAFYAATAQRLLGLGDRPAAAIGCDGSTRFFRAWSACNRGHLALAGWDIAAAEGAFREAIHADATYAHPRVWLAQAIAWREPEVNVEWRDQARQALRSRTTLSERDQNVAAALVAMGERDYPAACENYSRVVRADSLDAGGWYGLGECKSRDRLVVSGPGSPARWRFRTSYYGAALAYMRALTLEPGIHGIFRFERFHQLLPTAPTIMRTGRNAAKQFFAAYPSLSGDSIAFVPYPPAAFANIRGRQLDLRQAAIDRNINVLLAFASDWTARAPTNPLAFEALAEMLEIRGDIGPDRRGRMSAMAAVQRAEQLAKTPGDRMRIRVQAVWLRFKQRDFAGARVLADSALRESSGPSVSDARALIGVAALTGKVARTAELAMSTDAFVVSDAAIPVPIRGVAANYFAHAALGVCTGETDRLERQLLDQISAYVVADQQFRLRQDLRSRPLSMIAPCTGGHSSLRVDQSGDMQLRLQAALARGDTTQLRALFDTVNADARTQRPGDFSLDYTYQMAWVRAASGDTAGAITQLDRVLNALPSLNRWSLREPVAAAAAGRAMGLRAELAAAQDDHVTSRRWARSVLELWATADPVLTPYLSRMKSLAAGITR